jgi:hypothetical protein
MNRRSHLRNALFSLAFLPWVAAQEAAPRADLPSAESILDRYVEVTGGAAAYKSRTSETTTGTFTIVAANLTGQLRASVKPGMVRTTIELPGVGRIDSGVTDGVAWAEDPFAGPRILTGFQAAFAIANARPGATADWREQYSSVEVTGIEDVNGEPAYRVVQTLAEGESLRGFYSVDSGLLLKLAFTAEAPVEIFYEEYARVEGILTPTSIVQMAAGQRIVMNFTSLEVNVDIPDEQFAPPEGVQALLQ